MLGLQAVCCRSCRDVRLVVGWDWPRERPKIKILSKVTTFDLLLQSKFIKKIQLTRAIYNSPSYGKLLHNILRINQTHTAEDIRRVRGKS